MTVVVRRSALRMWLLAMAGIPFLVLGLDVVTHRRLTNALREMLFRPEDTQIFEPRDEIWAWAMVAFGVTLILWGLKELFVPTAMIEARPEALLLKLSGPFRPPTSLPWARVMDIDVISVEDDGAKIPLLAVEVDDPALLPDNPWGARWIGPKEIGILTEDWAEDPHMVAEALADYAVQNAVLDVGAVTEEE
ncbi:MAG TPA: hypothetical protein VF246_01485 [Acidimicrobiia bacterium]